MALTLTEIEKVVAEELPPVDLDSHPNVTAVPLPPVRRGVGHPNMYREYYARMALGYSLLGATNEQLCKLFGISHQTLNVWMDRYEAFGQAIEEGRSKADLFVAAGYYRRATGYTQRTRTLAREAKRGPSVIGADGKEIPGPVLAEVERVTEVETHFPADPTAASRWLQLRQNWNVPEKSVITVEDIVRVASMARAEAARRGISFAAAVEIVQSPENDFH